MAGYLLDTRSVIRHLRGRKPIVQLLRGLGQRERLAIATMTRLEVAAGMREHERYATRKLLRRFVNLPLDAEIADRAGALVQRGQQIKQPVAVPDAVIAATALQHGLTLVTLNWQDFAPIQGLRLHPHDF